jgi:hypothetical protein
MPASSQDPGPTFHAVFLAVADWEDYVVSVILRRADKLHQ